MENEKPDGKIVAEVGERRKRKFKSFLASRGLTFKKWLITTIDMINERHQEKEGEK